MGLEHDLEVYLKENGYLGSTPVFKKFIESKTSITKVEGTEKYKYEFKTAGENPVHQTIRDFLKQPQHKKFIDKFERNEKAESCYKRTIYNKIDQKIPEKKRGDKICRIFYIILDEKLPTTSVIKQCEKRYQQLINKVDFDLEQIELIKIGMFFFTVIYHLAKQEKIKTQADVQKSKPEESSTKKTELDSVFNTPKKLHSQIPSKCLPYHEDFDDLESEDEDFNDLESEDEDYKPSLIDILSALDSTKIRKKLSKLKPGTKEVANLMQWLNEKRKVVESRYMFNQKLQEGVHNILVTRDSLKYIEEDDPFLVTVFDSSQKDFSRVGLYEYPYFFKGSKKEPFIIAGEDTGLFLYSCRLKNTKMPLKSLKPIWFRDITKENKKYKQLKLTALQEVAEYYVRLLSIGIVKYIQVTFQCKENGIYVSFKTNHFEQPMKVAEEEEFKELYNEIKNDPPENKREVVFRGIHYDDKWKRDAATFFQKLLEEGVSYNVTKHNEQAYGAGVYWSKDFYNTALQFGEVVAMGITTLPFPHPPHKEMLVSGMYIDAFLMKDNQSIIVRKKAMYNAVKYKLTPAEEAYLKKNHPNIVICKTEEDIEKWKNCE